MSKHERTDNKNKNKFSKKSKPNIDKEEVQLPQNGVIAELLANPMYSLTSQIGVIRIEMYLRTVVSPRELNWPALLTTIGMSQRLAVISRGALLVSLLEKLTRFRSERSVKRALKHASAVMSRMHFLGLKHGALKCMTTIRHNHYVMSVAFSGNNIATGSWDNTAKVCHLNPNGSAKTLFNIRHTRYVNSVALNPSAPYLATGGWGCSVNLWRVNDDDSSAECVSTLREHDNSVDSIAFHKDLPYLVTASADSTAKLMRLSDNGASAKCVFTLKGHSSWIRSVIFHPSEPYIVTGSADGTVKFWDINLASNEVTCFSTLKVCDENGGVFCLSFDKKGDYLAVAMSCGTMKIWRMSTDGRSATCVLDLKTGERDGIGSVAFHPDDCKILVIGSFDGSVKLLFLNNDRSAVTYVSTLEVPHDGAGINSVAFHPSAPYLATAGSDKTAKLWR
jgi:WD40 repeat protein